MARTFPPSIVDDGPKLRVLIIAKWRKPEKAKKRGDWALKKTHSSETEIFSGWSEWESCSPGCTSDMPCWQISQFQYKKIDFWPLISKFRGQNYTFSSLAANWNPTGQCFHHNKGVSLAPWYEDTKSFTPYPPQKKWIFGPKTAKFGPKLTFLAKSGPKNQCEQGA